MSYSRKRRTILLCLALFLSVAVILFLLLWRYLPYQHAAERKIISTLSAMGLQVKSLEVSELDEEHAKLSNITLGEEKPLRVGELSATYHWQEAIKGKLQTLTLKNMEAHLYTSKEGLRIGGLEPLFKAGNVNTDYTPYFNASYWQNLLPEQAEITNGNLVVDVNDIKARAPFSVDISTAPILECKLSSTGLQADLAPYTFTTGALKAELALDEKESNWQGNFTLANISITPLPQPVPVLNAKGTLSITPKTLNTRFHVNDIKSTILAEGSISAPLQNPEQGTLTLSRIRYPFAGGGLIAENIRVGLKPAPITAQVRLEKVDLQQLFTLLGEGKISGTGVLNGALPVTYSLNGTITLGEGDINADGAGIITVSPSAIPGDNQQVNLLRQALQNFHYDNLRIHVSLKENNTPLIQLTVEGNNPDVMEGKAIKLNVNLGGDVLPLIQQSILPVRDPAQLLKQKE